MTREFRFAIATIEQMSNDAAKAYDEAFASGKRMTAHALAARVLAFEQVLDLLADVEVTA